MPDVQLHQREARLVYLATIYHLGRPGSELDPVTRQPHGLGLTPVHQELARQLEGDGAPMAHAHAAITLALSEYQLERLGEALLGLVNELKQVELSGRSVVAGFMAALTRLFPEITPADPSGALDLAGEATLLRRRLTGAIREAAAALERARATEAGAPDTSSPARAWWKVWGR